VDDAKEIHCFRLHTVQPKSVAVQSRCGDHQSVFSLNTSMLVLFSFQDGGSA